MKGIHIGEVLMEQGAITKEQLNEGLKLLKAETNDRRLAEVLTKLGYITERELLEVLGCGMGLEVIDLEFFQIDERAVEKIPKQLALKYTIMAVFMEGSCLTVATADPLDLYALEDIRLVTNCEKLTAYIERNQTKYSRKMMRIKHYHVVEKTAEELIQIINTVPRWQGVFDIRDGQIYLRTFRDVENLIDLFDERYTVSLVTGDEFDTDVKRLAAP